MPVGILILVRLPKPVPDEQTLWNSGADLRRDLELEEDDFYNPAPLSLVAETELDLVPVVCEKSVWIEFNLSNSYYGCGYERGDIELYVRCAQWLEEHLSNSEVYYGTDCGETPSIFDRQVRAKFLNYYRQVGNEPYRHRSQERSAQLEEIWERS